VEDEIVREAEKIRGGEVAKASEKKGKNVGPEYRNSELISKRGTRPMRSRKDCPQGVREGRGKRDMESWSAPTWGKEGVNEDLGLVLFRKGGETRKLARFDRRWKGGGKKKPRTVRASQKKR